MPKKPLPVFIISLILFLMTFTIGDFLHLELSYYLNNGVRLTCFALSVFGSIYALIKAVKEIKKKETPFVANLVAIIGSTLILCATLAWIYLLAALTIGGFPGQD